MTKIVIALAGLLLCGCSAFAADTGAREAFRRIDTNGDRKLEFSEIQAARARMFDRLDANHNGVLDPEEVQAAVAQVKAKPDQVAFKDPFKSVVKQFKSLGFADCAKNSSASIAPAA